MKLLTNLFYSAKKKMQGVKDGENETFRDSLKSIVASKDSLSEEEISAKVDELKSTCSLLPDSEGKTLLERYLEDFKVVKNQDEETAQKAVETIANLFERLDSKASEEPTTEPATDEGETVEEKKDESETKDEGETEEEKKEVSEPSKDEGETEEEKKEVSEPSKDEGETVEEKKEETSEKSTDSNETKDEGKFSQEDLEQIWQFIKQKLEEETATTDGDKTEGEGKSESEEKEKTVSDHAPKINVKITKDKAGKVDALNDIFNKMFNVR